VPLSWNPDANPGPARTPEQLRGSKSGAPEATELALVLSASEIASFAFCPEAWYLQRRGVARNTVGVRNLEQGTVAHRLVGRRVDRVRGLERTRRLVLLAVAILLAALLLQFLSAGGLLRP
jgi:hypothetical protein